MEDKRRQLYPVMRKYQENPNNRVALVRDRLYINGEQYIPPAATNTGENQTRKPKKSSEQTTEESRRYIRGARYSQRAEIETNNQFEVSSEAAQINLLSENNDSDPEPSQVSVVSHMKVP